MPGNGTDEADEVEDGSQGGARKEVVVEKQGGSRVGQLTHESWQELASCLTGEACEKCPVRWGMRECEGCGALVSARFARVFGDNQGDVHACPECGVQGHYSAGGGRP